MLAGYNDLASVSPALAQQLDYRKNMPLVPADVSAGSQRSVWWRCEKGHSWRAAVRSRTVGSGCPIKQLSLGENDLAALYPALAKQWDAEKNGRLTPRDVLPGAEKKVWWRCERGHSWRAAVSSRTRAGGGCPYCAGKQVLPGFNDLASQRPELAAQWDGEKNRALTPQQVTITSNRKVWWRCEKGHSYPVVIASRTNGSGCDSSAHYPRQRLPILFRAKGARRVQRPRHSRARHCGPMAPDAQRRAHPADGEHRQPEKGLVGMPPGPRLESCHLPPHRRKKMRLPGLRRKDESAAAASTGA